MILPSIKCRSQRPARARRMKGPQRAALSQDEPLGQWRAQSPSGKGGQEVVWPPLHERLGERSSYGQGAAPFLVSKQSVRLLEQAIELVD